MNALICWFLGHRRVYRFTNPYCWRCARCQFLGVDPCERFGPWFTERTEDREGYVDCFVRHGYFLPKGTPS